MTARPALLGKAADILDDPARFLLQVSNDGARIDVWCLDCKTGPGEYFLVVSTMNSSLGRFCWHCADHERGYHDLDPADGWVTQPDSARVASGHKSLNSGEGDSYDPAGIADTRPLPAASDPCPPRGIVRPRNGLHLVLP